MLSNRTPCTLPLTIFFTIFNPFTEAVARCGSTVPCCAPSTANGSASWTSMPLQRLRRRQRPPALVFRIIRGLSHRLLFIALAHACNLPNGREISLLWLKFMNIFRLNLIFLVRLLTRPSQGPEYHRSLKAVAWDDGSSHGQRW